MRKPFSVSVFARLLSTEMSEVKNLPAAYLSECADAADDLSASIADVLEESADSLHDDDAGFTPLTRIASLQSLCASNLRLLNDVRNLLSWANANALSAPSAPAAPIRGKASADVKALTEAAQLMGERLAPVDVKTNHMAIYPAIELARGIADALANKAACAGLIAAHVDADGADELAADLSQLARFASKLAEALPEIDGATAVWGDVDDEEEEL